MTAAAVIERLRASKQEHVQSESESGKLDGRKWAEESATYGELRRLSEVEIPTSDNALDILADVFGDELSKEEAWEYCFGDDDLKKLSEEYVEAWIVGTQEVYDEVSDKL